MSHKSYTRAIGNRLIFLNHGQVTSLTLKLAPNTTFKSDIIHNVGPLEHIFYTGYYLSDFFLAT